jgi:hypothetical protein
MSDKALDLLAGGFAEGLGAAEIDGVRLDQVGIKLVLADELAEAVADFGTAIVSVLAIDWLGRKLLRLAGRWSRLGKGAELFDRADADAVGLAQGPVNRSGLGHAHLGAADQGRDIRRVGVAVADKTFAIPGFKDRGFECPSFCGRIGELPEALYIYSRTFPSLSDS